MSRPGSQATPQEYAGHLVGSTAVGAPIDRTPSGTYSIFNIRIKAGGSTLSTCHPPFPIADGIYLVHACRKTVGHIDRHVAFMIRRSIKNAKFDGSDGSVDVTELNFSITKWVWPMMSFPEFNCCGAP
jgi:hypothetical protein